MSAQPWLASLDGIAPAAAIEHAFSLLETSPLLAEHQACAVLLVLPDDARAVYIIGAARRRLGDLAQALPLLELVANRRPDIGRACQELAFAQAAAGRGQAALETLRAQARRGAPVDWLEAAGEFGLAGEARAAAIAEAEYFRQASTDHGLRAAIDAVRAGHDSDAVLMLRAHLGRAPNDAAALLLLAAASLRLKWDGGADASAHAVTRAPDSVIARTIHARALLAAGEPLRALAQIAAMLPEARSTAPMRHFAALCHVAAGALDEAARLMTDLTSQNPGLAWLWLLHGRLQRALGDAASADAALLRACVLRPDLEAEEQRILRATPCFD